jgi:hypothetical protein
LEAGIPVCAVTKWFVFAVAAAAEGDSCPSAKIKFLPRYIKHFKVTFYTDAPVIFHSNLCCHRLLLLLLRALVLIGRNDAPEKQLAALRIAEKADPNFEAVLWHLAVFYYKRAQEVSGAEERERPARVSAEYFIRYCKSSLKDTMFIERARKMRD